MDSELARISQKENSNYPIVSIIIISYNNLKYIKECIDSVICQNYPRIELIVSDDGSKDFRADEIEDYIWNHSSGNISRCLVTTNKVNLGTVRNINKAVTLSSGEYIKCIAADDKLIGNNAVTSYVCFQENNAEYDIVFCDAVIVRPNGEKWIHKSDQFESLLKTPADYFSRLCEGNFIVAGTACFRKIIFEKYGVFDERFFLLDDWPMWLKVSRMGCRFGFLNETHFEYKAEIGCSSASGKNKKYEEDVEKCFKYCILPYINEFEPQKQIRILDQYFEQYVHTKGRMQEMAFLISTPWYLWKKLLRRLTRS